ncbi:uncharacterized protein LOC135645862 [Musa acuminata AAA Group]|uniref:uncharacterized protein LOC135645862 n=1 Tax=Musa acuminata AAA Group TaxID=214697 RepID=UPI0031D61C7E
MSKPYKRIINGFGRLYTHEFPASPAPRSPISWGQTRFLISNPFSSCRSSNLSPSSDSASPNRIFSRLFALNCNSRHRGPVTAAKLPSLGFGIKGLARINENGCGSRFFSFKSLNYGKYSSFGVGMGKSVVDKPLSAVSSAFSRYRQVVGLQMEAFWKRNHMILVWSGAVVVCIVLWRIMFGIASTFVGLSEGTAKYGFLALASAIVAFAGMCFRARFAINPDKVYRLAMSKLNASAGILEVMGAPLTGTDLRAYVTSGGQPKLKNFKLKFGDKRCFLLFPVRGSERKGLVSVEVKKKKGQYVMKLLAVDIPMASGPDQRLFVLGDEQEYRVGGGLISELRDPIVKAMSAEKEFQDLDQKEDEEDEIREREEAERRQQVEKQRALEQAEKNRHEEEKRSN